MRLVVAALVFALSFSIGHGAGKESPEATETTIDLRLIQVLLEEQIKLNDGKLDGPERPVTIREFSKSLSREIARRMVFKDGWGNEFMVVGNHESFLVSSAGEDRVHDLMYLVGKGAEATEGLIIEHGMGDDILLFGWRGSHRGSPPGFCFGAGSSKAQHGRSEIHRDLHRVVLHRQQRLSTSG